MKCPKCGNLNPERNSYCINCGKELMEKINNDYCPNCSAPLLYPDKPCPNCSSSDNLSNCINCKTPINNSLIFSNAKKLSRKELLLLDFNETNLFCENCYKLFIAKAKDKEEFYKNKFLKVSENMPIMNIENPKHIKIGKYLSLVSGQSIMKTDLNYSYQAKKSETMTDFEYKLNNSEKKAKEIIKQKTISLGGNAIIGCTINYQQLYESKNLFLISIIGTAINADNLETLSDKETNVYNYFAKSL